MSLFRKKQDPIAVIEGDVSALQARYTRLAERLAAIVERQAQTDRARQHLLIGTDQVDDDQLAKLNAELRAIADEREAIELAMAEVALQTDDAKRQIKDLRDQEERQRVAAECEARADAIDAAAERLADAARIFADARRELEHAVGEAAIGESENHPRWMAELFFGNGDDIEKLFAKGGDAFQKSVEEYGKTLEPITQEMLKQSEALRKGLLDFNEALDKLETKAGPTIIKGMNDVLGEFTTLFANLDRFEHWFEATNFKQKANDAGAAIDDQVGMSRKALHDKYHGEGDYAPATSAADAQTRLGDLQSELKRLQDNVEADKAKNPIGFPARHGEDFQHIRELGAAIRALQEQIAKGIPEPEKMSFRTRGGGGGALLQKASFIGFESGNDGPIAAGTKAGVLAAFREMMQDRSVDQGARTGLQRASFETGSLDGVKPGPHNGYGMARLRRRGGGGGAPVDMKGFGGQHHGNWWTPGREQHAVERLMKEAGLSQSGAEGLVSRWANVEAGAGPTAHNPISGAVGIGQWLGSRKHGFTGDFDSQISHAVKELNGPESVAGRALREARNAREGAIGASRFERAEHYDPRTGIDEWTGKSMAGAGRVHRDIVPLLPVPRPAAVDVSGSTKVDIHLHDPGRHVRRTAVSHTGDVMASLKRWPGMPLASDQG